MYVSCVCRQRECMPYSCLRVSVCVDREGEGGTTKLLRQGKSFLCVHRVIACESHQGKFS